NRNSMLNWASYHFGRMIVEGFIQRSVVEELLRSAAWVNGLWREDGPAQCKATIKSGIDAGMSDAQRDTNIPMVPMPRSTMLDMVAAVPDMREIALRDARARPARAALAQSQARNQRAGVAGLAGANRLRSRHLLASATSISSSTRKMRRIGMIASSKKRNGKRCRKSGDDRAQLQRANA